MSVNPESSLIHSIKTLIIESSNLGNIKPEDIDENTTLFKGGLGLDSIDMLEIAVNLEKRFGLRIQNNEEGRKAFESVNKLSQAVHGHLNRLM
jgi:acyl carrier protein